MEVEDALVDLVPLLYGGGGGGSGGVAEAVAKVWPLLARVQVDVAAKSFDLSECCDRIEVARGLFDFRLLDAAISKFEGDLSTKPPAAHFVMRSANARSARIRDRAVSSHFPTKLRNCFTQKAGWWRTTLGVVGGGSTETYVKVEAAGATSRINISMQDDGFFVQ
jgi:hypothetical protein